MIRFEIDELVKKAGNRYALVIGSAKRAREIKDYMGSVSRHEIPHVVPPQVELNETIKGEALSIAMKEIIDEKIEFIVEEDKEEQTA